MNYYVTKLQHVFLFELNFNKDKSDRRAGIFRFKRYYQTQTLNLSVQVIKSEYSGKERLNKQQIL